MPILTASLPNDKCIIHRGKRFPPGKSVKIAVTVWHLSILMCYVVFGKVPTLGQNTGDTRESSPTLSQ